MSTLTAPTADEIYKRAAEKGIQPQHFVDSTTGELMTDSSTVLEFITNNILPDWTNIVNVECDRAARVFDFPFSSENLKLAFPNKSDDAIADIAGRQDAYFHKAIELYALADVFARVATMNPEFELWSTKYKMEADTSLALGIKYIEDLTGLTEAGQNAGLSGFGVVEINTDPPPLPPIFGFFDYGTFNQ